MKEMEYFESWINDPEFKSLRWKANIAQVLEEIDDQLKAHSLEIVMLGDGGWDDEFVWKIDKRKKE